MTTQSITPVRLLRDSLISVIPIYKSLLILYTPLMILSLSKFVIPELSFRVVSYLYDFLINTIFDGALIFFSYKKLNQEEVTILQSLQKAIEKFPELLFLDTLRFLVLITWFPRLYFLRSLVLIKDYSSSEVFKQCWQLTRGYGWQIFWNYLTLWFIFIVLSFIPSLISASIFDVSVWDINREELSITNSALIVNRLLILAINFFVAYPLSITYNMLMFVRLLALEKRNLSSVAM